MKELGYGDNYQYPHDHPGHFIEDDYLPEKIAGTRFWNPAENPREREIRERMNKLWEKRYKY
jgi:putative ATPase